MRYPVRLIHSVVVISLLLAVPATALVWYEQGRLNVDGVEMFQDTEDRLTYYYLPPAPALALTAAGTPQLLCIKYVDPDGESSGGLLHFLATLELPAERVAELEELLRERVPGAKIAGPLPLLEHAGEGQGQVASFQVVSAVLNDTEEGGFTRTVITSGHAPVTPGSRAAVAAHLDPRGATLLWDSFGGATSDVSVSLAAEYEARVEGYNATVFAEVETVYEHFSAVLNKQEGYSKRELRQIVDELQHDNVITVEVFDRSKGLGIDASALEGILSLVTDKLVTLMFDHQAGLAKMPDRETAVSKGQIKGRQTRGFITKLFTGSGNQPYVTDNQFVLKSRKDVRRTSFSLNLSMDTTIRLPVFLAGNMGGLYADWGEERDVFRVVNLGDPAFELREVRFVVDGDWAARFPGLVNWVSAQLHKDYGEEHPSVDGQIQLSASDVSAGRLEGSVQYPRLGMTGDEWLTYKYRVNWSLLRHDTVSQPAGEGWAESAAPIITLRPPLEFTDAELEVDREAMTAQGVRVGVVEVRNRVLGSTGTRRATVLRVTDAEPAVSLEAVHDPGAAPEVRVTWIAERGGGSKTTDWMDMTVGYLWLEPPDLTEATTEDES